MHNPRTNYKLGTIAFSPNSKTLAAGYSFGFAEDAGSGEVLLWNVDLGRVRRRLRERTHVIDALAFRPDGTVLAVGLGTPGDAETDDPVRLWDAVTGRPLRAFKAPIGDYKVDSLC